MQPTTKVRLAFSQRHPFIFGFLCLILAVVLFMGAMAFFAYLADGPLSGPRIGVVRIEGMISDVQENLEWIAKLEANESVHGVLVRVDSPGGGVAASQELHDAIKRLAKHKPVVVSMGSLAASGGLMVSMGATHIVANAATITGSIGVKMEMPDVEKLMHALGLQRQVITSGDFKDAGTPFRTMTEAERVYLQSVVMELYEQFVSMIAEDRGLDMATVKSFADGRILTGAQAYSLGLVDQLGGQTVALEALAKLCRKASGEALDGESPASQYELLELPKERPWLRELLESSLGISAPKNMTSPQFMYY